MTNSETNNQRRAVCPACFAEQAITSRGRLVAHGYTRPQHWNANIGTCSGAGLPHFGTEAGRDQTARIAARLREIAEATRESARRTREGIEPVRGTKRIPGTRVAQTVIIENATAEQREHAARGLDASAANADANARELDKAVATWAPREPRAVTVEKKTALVHFRSRHAYGGGKLCAGSAMAAHKGDIRSDRAAVTCPKCAARYAYHDREEAARAARAAAAPK